MVRRFVTGIAIASLMTAVAGCGWFNSASAPVKHHPKNHQALPPSSSSTPSTSNTSNATNSTSGAGNNTATTPSNTIASNTNTTSSGASNSTSSSPSSSGSPGSTGSTSNTPPLPPNAGSFSELKVSVLHVTPDGTASSSGHSEVVYLLQLRVQNPSSGNVSLALNDFSAIPVAGSYAYSWNDYASAGLSSTNSLFPWPVSPKTPAADTRYVFSGNAITGDVTVEVPGGHSQYELVWGTSNQEVATTFVP